MKKWHLLLTLSPLLLYGDAEPPQPAAPEPSYTEPSPVSDTPAGSDIPDFWSTGPLIAPPADVIDFGHFNYQPYLYWTSFNGIYDDQWKFQSLPLFTSVSVQPLIRIGVFSSTEFDLTPIVYYNHTEHAAQWVWGDIPISLDSLLLDDDPDHWYHPSVKIRFSANLPTGKYQKLKADKLGTDIGGTGSWAPGVGLILYHAAHVYRSHYFAATGFVTYQYQNPVHVKGLNAYGGDVDTRGKVYPGGLFQAILSLEYSISHRWILALDTIYTHINKTRFRGHTSVDSPNTLPSSEQISLAPGIEYMWNENFGMNAGAWLTVGGRNTDQFVSGVFSIYINK